ncbi:HPr family phosphocarrier protein [Streptomyces massasporeus]
MLGVLTLGARYGEKVTLTAEGEQAEAVLQELSDLLSKELDA